MRDKLQRPLTCPALIGRDQALAVVEEVLAASQGGHGQTLLLTGEAGIGKSRVARDARTRAEAAGMTVLQGDCFESDRTVPYAPVLDLLRNFCSGREAAGISEAFGPWAPVLHALLPELPAGIRETGLTPTLGPIQERRDLYYALAQFIMRLAATRPVLLIVEDLHFADTSSIDALLYLARRAGNHRLLLLLTYRIDEVGRDLAHLLAGLDREQLALRLTLEPLNADQLEAMVRATLGAGNLIPSRMVQALYELTEGNPFFVEEVLRSLGPDLLNESGSGARDAWDQVALAGFQGFRMPGIQESVQRRTERLSPGTRQLLIFAAILGRRFDFTLLQGLTQLDEPGLLGQIREAIAAQLVAEESPETFAFRHELTRQAILADLLAREQRTLHARVAEALEQMPGSPVADLASHFYAAGNWPKTLGYAEQAGEQALAVYAPRAAIEQFSRALLAADQLGLPAAHLHVRRGQARELLGEFAGALQDYTTAVQAAQSGGDRRAECEVLLLLGFLWAGRSYLMAGDCFQRALRLVREIDDPALLGHNLNRIGNWCLNQDLPTEAACYHREALSIFAELGDRAGQAESLELLGSARHFSGDQMRADEDFTAAEALYRQLGDHRGLVSVLAESATVGPLTVTGTTVTVSQDVDRVIQRSNEAIAIANAMGWRAGEAMARFLLAHRLAWHGYYGGALDCAKNALSIAEEIEHRQWMSAGHYILGVIYLDLLALPGARRHLDAGLALAHETGAQVFVAEIIGGLIQACTLQRDHARARALLDSAPDEAEPKTLGQRCVQAARAEYALATHDPKRALELVEQLIASAQNPDNVPIPRLAFLRGEALLHLGRLDESAEALAAAREAAYRQQGRPLLWRIELTLGRLQRRAGHVQAAREHYRAARATAETLASDIPEPELRAEFARQIGTLIPAVYQPAAAQTARRASDGLTAREHEVAALIAEGKSNHQIAETLVVSERTIEGHISSILNRLGFNSRVQIAAWITEGKLHRQQAPQ